MILFAGDRGRQSQMHSAVLNKACGLREASPSFIKLHYRSESYRDTLKNWPLEFFILSFDPKAKIVIRGCHFFINESTA